MSKQVSAETVINECQDSIPRHVGIIMDGNGRWAQKRKMPRAYGHKKGVDAVRRAVRFATQLGIESLTLFAFSSENWKRPQEEVSGLMDLFMLVLTKEVKTLHKNNIKLNIIGDVDGFSESIQDKVIAAQEMTKHNGALTLNIAANYGGRWDITQACRVIAEKVANKQISTEQITEQLIDEYVSCSDQAPLDLMIRTGGETRISNFLLWQAAYAELHFCSLYWPEFDDNAFANAVMQFAGTERRFGLTGEQIKS